MSEGRVKLLVCAPHWPEDIATAIWAPYLIKAVKRLIEEKGVEAVVLYADQCVRAKFWEALQDTAIRAVTGVGHGNEKVFTGQRFDLLLTVHDEPPPALKGGAFFPVSCLVGAQLCPTLIGKGVAAAIGNVTEYWFTAERDVQSGEDLDEDRLLRYFLHCEYRVLHALLLSGYPIGYAWREMRKAYEEKAREAAQVDSLTAWCLYVDGSNRLLFGDESWTLLVGVKKTKVTAGGEGERDPYRRVDVVAVAGKVETEEGEPAKGYVDIVVSFGSEEKRVRAELEDGCFSAAVAFDLTDNAQRRYTVNIYYPGWMEEGRLVYSPSSTALTVVVEPVGLESVVKLERVEAEQSDLMADFTITGVLTDAGGAPLPDRYVFAYIVAIGYGHEVTASAKTDENGRFTITTSLPGDYFKTVRYKVRVWFPGDQWFKEASTETEVKVTFWPRVSWWVILAAAALIALLIYIFTQLL